MGLSGKSGQFYVGQAVTAFACTLDQDEKTPFVIVVNPSESDSNAVGVISPSGEALTLPVWFLKQMPTQATQITTAGTTASIGNIYGAK